MAGRTVGQIYYIEMMLNEMTSYLLISILLVVIFLLISFKSLWGLLVPQIVILGSMIWIAGFMAWIDKPINILLIVRSEEHTSELQSRPHLVCRLLLEKK